MFLNVENHKIFGLLHKGGGSCLPAPFLILTILPAPFLPFFLLPSNFCEFPTPCSQIGFNLPAHLWILPILPAPWLPLWEAQKWTFQNGWFIGSQCACHISLVLQIKMIKDYCYNMILSWCHEHDEKELKKCTFHLFHYFRVFKVLFLFPILFFYRKPTLPPWKKKWAPWVSHV